MTVSTYGVEFVSFWHEYFRALQAFLRDLQNLLFLKSRGRRVSPNRTATHLDLRKLCVSVPPWCMQLPSTLPIPAPVWFRLCRVRERCSSTIYLDGAQVFSRVGQVFCWQPTPKTAQKTRKLGAFGAKLLTTQGLSWSNQTRSII